MEAMKKTDDEFYTELCEGVNVVKYPDGGIAVAVGFDRGVVGDDDLEEIWGTLVPETFAEFECLLDPEDCTMTLYSAAPLTSFIVRKASVALYLMAKRGVPAREALVIMGDGMLFDLFNFKEPYGISEVNIAQFPSIFFLYVAGGFVDRCDLFLKDKAGLKDLGETLDCDFIFYDETAVVFSISILGIQTMKVVMDVCIENKLTPTPLVKMLRVYGQHVVNSLNKK